MPYVFAGKLLCDTDGELLMRRLRQQDALLPRAQRRWPSGEPPLHDGKEKIGEASYGTGKVAIYSSEIWPIYVRETKSTPGDWTGAETTAENDTQDFYEYFQRPVHCCMGAKCQSAERVVDNEGDDAKGEVFGELLTIASRDIGYSEIYSDWDGEEAAAAVVADEIRPSSKQMDLVPKWQQRDEEGWPNADTVVEEQQARAATLVRIWETTLFAAGKQEEAHSEEDKLREILGMYGDGIDFEDAPTSFSESVEDEPNGDVASEDWEGAVSFSQWFGGKSDWVDSQGHRGANFFTVIDTGYGRNDHPFYLYDENDGVYWVRHGDFSHQHPEHTCPNNRNEWSSDKENIVIPDDAVRETGKCAWCDEELGEEHGYITEDFISETVYRQLDAEGDDEELVAQLEDSRNGRVRGQPQAAARLETHHSATSRDAAAQVDVETAIREEMQRAGMHPVRDPSLMPEPAQEAPGESRDRFDIIREELNAGPRTKGPRFPFTGADRRTLDAVAKRVIGFRVELVRPKEFTVWDSAESWETEKTLVLAAIEADNLRVSMNASAATLADKRAAADAATAANRALNNYSTAHSRRITFAEGARGNIVAARHNGGSKVSVELLVSIPVPSDRPAALRQFRFASIPYGLDQKRMGNDVRLLRPWREGRKLAIDLDPPEVVYTAAERRSQKAIIKRLMLRRVQFLDQVRIICFSEYAEASVGNSHQATMAEGASGVIVAVWPQSDPAAYTVMVHLDDPPLSAYPYAMCEYKKVNGRYAMQAYGIHEDLPNMDMRFLKGKGRFPHEPPPERAPRMIDLDDGSGAGAVAFDSNGFEPDGPWITLDTLNSFDGRFIRFDARSEVRFWPGPRWADAPENDTAASGMVPAGTHALITDVIITNTRRTTLGNDVRSGYVIVQIPRIAAYGILRITLEAVLPGPYFLTLQPATGAAVLLKPPESSPEESKRFQLIELDGIAATFRKPFWEW